MLGDKAKDVCTALQYLYQGCTVSIASALVIAAPRDAESLARFAHKYDIRPLLNPCEEFLVQQMQTTLSEGIGAINTGRALEDDVKRSGLLSSSAAVTHIVDLAETCGMNVLLAHCELFMMRSDDTSLWTDPAMLSN